MKDAPLLAGFVVEHRRGECGFDDHRGRELRRGSVSAAISPEDYREGGQSVGVFRAGIRIEAEGQAPFCQRGGQRPENVPDGRRT